MGKEDFITTASGVHFTPFSPQTGQIHADDIAHALSHLCRANGHCRHFYSVAQHSVNCAKEAQAREMSRRVQFACLLHDASEAYLSDVTRPVKRNIPTYLEFEQVLQDKIFETFGIGDLTHEELEQVKSVDDDMLWYEFERLMPEPLGCNPPQIISSPNLEQVDFQTVKTAFLGMLSDLRNQIDSLADIKP